MQINNLTDVTALIAILSFCGGIVIFLFKRIVIEPLQKSIDSLGKVIEGFKESSEKRMGMIEQRVDVAEDNISRHDERIKSLEDGLTK